MKNATPKNFTAIPDYKISKYVSKYISLNRSILQKQEQLELLLILLLDSEFRKLLDFEVEKVISTMHNDFSKGVMKSEISFSKKYTEHLDYLFGNTFFRKKYSKDEIIQRKRISEHFILDIAMAFFYPKGEVVISPLVYPTITHSEEKTQDHGNIIKLEFNKDLPLSMVIKYLKEQLGDFKRNKKPTKSLIKGLRLLYIESLVIGDPNLYNKQKDRYKEILYARIYKNMYGVSISMDDVVKNLQRVKRVQKELKN